MPRGRMQRTDILAKVYKLKTTIYEGKYEGASDDWREGAHYTLNKILNILDEYSS